MPFPFLQNVDLTTLGVWCVAVTSLLVQVYLLVTWPRPGKTVDPRLASNGSANADQLNVKSEVGNWSAPSDAALDGILGESFPTANKGLARQRRQKKQKEPVTMQQRIVRAGIYHKGGMRSFHLFRIGLVIACLFSGCLIIPFTKLPWVFAVYIGAFAALFGYLVPSFWLDYKLRKRQTTMRRALPDALDLVVVCLQGGLSLPASLSRVARELGPAHPMLATELAILDREIQMGRNTGGAMLQFAQRFDLEELRSLSSVIGQTEKYGGTVAGALKTYAESLRVRRRQLAEEMAQKAAVKLLFPTIFCIFPGIFVVILGPTAVRMYEVMSEVSFGG
jgi:tight adherence protein C